MNVKHGKVQKEMKKNSQDSRGKYISQCILCTLVYLKEKEMTSYKDFITIQVYYNSLGVRKSMGRPDVADRRMTNKYGHGEEPDWKETSGETTLEMV